MTAAREPYRPARHIAAGPGAGLAGRGSARILLVDDEPQIRGFVGRALERAGYQVDVAADGADGVDRVRGGAYDLVILDLIMPGVDGKTALAAIMRAQPDQAVLVLSCTSDVGTKVECLDLGARDYLTKPFSLAELIARVKVRFRDTSRQAELIHVGVLTLDARRLEADSGPGPVPLTRLEFLCLRALAERGGEPVAKSALLASVWGIDFDPGSNLVDVCIRRLRAKLGFGLIETVRGEGYRLAC
jgi:two-component system OmpR family response regulator